MKKLIATLITLALTLSLAVAPALANEKISIIATENPHAQILELVKDDLAALGYDLDITVVTDYVVENPATSDGSVMANFFQHIPYLNSYNEANGTDLVAAAAIHYEPFGIYGNGVTDLKDLKAGATILIPADDSNETRALLLLQQEGLITLPEDASAARA